MTSDAADIHASGGLDDAIAYQLHRTNRLLGTHLARFLDGIHPGLTPEQFFIVLRLFQRGPLAQSELVDRDLQDGPNVSRLVERLVQAGLAQRSENQRDRRARHLELTTEGTELAAHLEECLVPERRAVFAGIGAGELDSLVSLLGRINTNVRALLDNPRH